VTIEEIQARLRAIVDAADGRDLTDEEHAEIEGLEADLAAARERRERTLAARKRIEDGEKVVTAALVTGAPVQGPDNGLEAAFTAYLRTGRENADIQELRAAQSEGTPSEGGFLVPPGIRSKIVERMVDFGGLANVVDEITTDTGNELPWLTEDDDTANRAEQVAEGGTMAGGADFGFGKVTLGAYSYMAGGTGGLPLRLSRELVQDSAFDIVGRLARKLGERGARLRSQLIVSGTGVNQPQGIVTGRTGAGMYSGGSDALVYADFLNVIHSVDPAYRKSGNCRWAFNDTFAEVVEGILDGNNRPLLKPAGEGISSDPSSASLLGFPVTIDQAFSNPTATSATVNFGVFGDLREGYVIRNVRAVELLVNPYSRMANRQIEYSTWFRFDALQQNTNAYVALTGTA
jgi:HK97 family phage major capsid protein